LDPQKRGAFGGTVLIPSEVISARDLRASGRAGRASNSSDNRTPSQKDVDTVLYARSFLRLATVTQIATPDPLRPAIHNRLTHSLKVAQIARTIAGNLICAARKRNGRDLKDLILHLGGLDASVAEAAALAHDIGHPPFGHAGETVLDKLSRRRDSPIPIADGFEGNAQSFRDAVKVDPMYGFHYGLDLTAATRAAILKYPWPRPTTEIRVPPNTPKAQQELRKRKFGYYQTEKAEFELAREWLPEAFKDASRPRQSLECSVMDIADDITYAVHDYEDFLTMGALHVDTVRADLDELVALSNVGEKKMRAGVDALVDELASYDKFDLGVLRDVAKTHRAQIPSLFLSPYNRQFRNRLLDTILAPGCIQVNPTPQREVGSHIILATEAWHLVEMLKFFVKHYVINSSGLALLQAGQGALLRKGIERFIRWHDEDPERLPVELKERLIWSANQGEAPARPYLDYICTLGDEQFEVVTLSMSGERTTRFGSGAPVG
jgi:dGTPase